MLNVRRTAGLLGATIIAATLAPVTAAHASSTCTGNSTCSSSNLTPTSGGSGSLAVTLGGTINRATIINRAKEWSTSAVPYTGSPGNWDYAPWAFWTDSQVGGPYRQDCSGLADMAWGLGSNPNGNGLAASYATELTDASGNPDPSQLQPGDILISSGHVVVFNGWAAADHSKYYAIEETPPNVIGGDNSDVVPYPYWSTNGVPNGAGSGYGGTYWPYRYKNVSESTPPPAAAPALGEKSSVLANGVRYTFTRDASNGHLQVTSVTSAGVWNTKDLTSSVSTPVSAGGAPAAFVQTDGTMGAITADSANGHVQMTYMTSVGTWYTSDMTSLAGTAVSDGSISATAAADGNVYIFSRNSANGHLSGTHNGGTWATVDLTAVVGTPVSAGAAPSAFLQTDGTMGVITADSSNGHVQMTYETSAGAWTSVDMNTVAGTAASDGSISATAAADGKVYIFSRNSANGHLSGTHNGGTWATVDLTAVVGTPVSAGAAPSAFLQTDGTMGVITANSSNGHVQMTYETSAGAWYTADMNSLAGTPVSNGSVSATTGADGKVAIVSIGSTNGNHVSTTSNGSTWATADLTTIVGTPAAG